MSRSHSRRAAVRAGLCVFAAITLSFGSTGRGDDVQADAPPAQASLDAARTLYLAGDYSRAAAIYDKMAADPAGGKAALAAAVARSNVELQTGDYVSGIARMTALEAVGKSDAGWHAALADLQEQVGRYDEAIALNSRALELDKRHFRARAQLGCVLEMLGRIDEAIKVLKPFNDLMTGGSLPDAADELTWVGEGFLRYSALSRHAELANRTRHVLQHVYQEAFDTIDANYWPARLAAAQLLLDKYNMDEARDDFKAILDKNKNVADAHVALGLIALIDRWDFEMAEKAVDSAIAINPHHVGARLLQAKTRMMERRYRAAASAARKALAINPRHVEALSLLGAAQLRQGDRAACEATRKQVEAITAKPALFHHTLGLWLVMGRQFDEAEREFKKAMMLAPHWSAPGTELGIMYLDVGEDELSRTTLETAFDLDRFNRRTFNLIQLLDELDKFERLKTKHFIIKYEKETDFGFAARAAAVLEAMHDEICSHFNWTPDKPTIIEIHPSHRSFSIRIAGRPFIGTIGACTGRCIAMVQPRGRPPFGRFNWADTLRHEFTHTVTLGVTGNRIPHWLTEGLAVHEEPQARSWDWKNGLAQRVVDGELFTLDTIDWGFQRPRKGGDRQMAYAQSEWMVEFLIERFGASVVPALLKAFHDGRTQAEAMTAVLKQTPGEFDAAFEKWARAQVDAWALYRVQSRSLDALRAEADAHADDADFQANFARALLEDSEYEDAETAARRSIELKPDHAVANEVMAVLFVGRMLAEADEGARADYMEVARPFIRKLAELRPEHPLSLKFTAYLDHHDQDWREALQTYETYQARYPEDTDVYRRIIAIHWKLKNEKAARTWMERLAGVASDDVFLRMEIAGAKWQDGDFDGAVAWAQRTLDIDPYNQGAYSLIGEASLKLGNLAVAEESFEILCRLAPKSTIGFDGLVRIAESQGDTAKARALRKRIRKILHPRGDDVGWGW